jgi:hypothetical protein
MAISDAIVTSVSDSLNGFLDLMHFLPASSVVSVTPVVRSAGYRSATLLCPTAIESWQEVPTRMCNTTAHTSNAVNGASNGGRPVEGRPPLLMTLRR